MSVQHLLDRSRADLHCELDKYEWPSPWPDEASRDLHAALAGLTRGKTLEAAWLGRHLKRLVNRITAKEVLRVREDGSRGNHYWLTQTN
ncbi:MAG: hypothetical protein ABL879_18560 [Devosia sp.]